jgi:hypothetical protein
MTFDEEQVKSLPSSRCEPVLNINSNANAERARHDVTMNEWLAQPPDAMPTLGLVADPAAMGALPVERVPLRAAQWLVDGHDGDDLRALAGLSGRDPREVHDLLGRRAPSRSR